MDYKSHAPAGLALACGVAIVTGMPIHIPYLIGGIIGGLLPDIDQEHSKINKIGQTVGDTTAKWVTKLDGNGGGGGGGPAPKPGGPGGQRPSGPGGPQRGGGGGSQVHIFAIFAIFLRFFGLVFDKLIMNPLAVTWRWFAHNIIGKIYHFIYLKFNMKDRNWSSQEPDVHRGGATHSLLFILWSSILLIPISWLISLIPPGGSWPLWFWLGCEIGIISHLLCDAACVSGTKFFWPFFPSVGFVRAEGNDSSRGKDVRIVPPALQMKTSTKINNKSYSFNRREKKEFKAQNDWQSDAYQTYMKWYRRKMGYQTLLRMAAILLLIVLVLGLGPASGVLAWGNEYYSITQPQRAAEMSLGVEDEEFDSPQSMANDKIEQVAPITNITPDNEEAKEDTIGTTVPEIEGPTSLTYGDVDADTLPKGIIKLPDESLWVVGVGPVNRVNLETPGLNLTQQEKERLLAAANTQRLNSEGTQTEDEEENSDQDNSSGSSGNVILDLLNGLLGTNVDSGDGILGFHGLTPFTDTGSSSSNTNKSN